MQFIENVNIVTDDFYYDLFLGGYIKPENLLYSKIDIDTVNNAIEIINQFKKSLDDNEIIEYM